MNKKRNLKVCNLCLIAVATMVLVSSVQMEICGGKGVGELSFSTMMYIHSFLGILMFVIVGYHLYLHLGKKHWITKVSKLSDRHTKWLCVVFAIMLILSTFVFVHVHLLMEHSIIGAVHGKIGFLFLAFCVGHTVRRWKWVRRQVLR